MYLHQIFALFHYTLTILIVSLCWTSFLGHRNHLLFHAGTSPCTRQIFFCRVGYLDIWYYNNKKLILLLLYFIIVKDIANINPSYDTKPAGLDLLYLHCSSAFSIECHTPFLSCPTTPIDPLFPFHNLTISNSWKHLILHILLFTSCFQAVSESRAGWEIPWSRKRKSRRPLL